MMTLYRLFVSLAAVAVLTAGPTQSRAEMRAESAANYIRGLFDTSMGAKALPDRLCPPVAQFGRFAAGHAWRLMPPVERPRFSQGFCTLAVEAVNRLQTIYPGLRLELTGVSPAAQEMMIVSSTVGAPGSASSWPIDWQIAGTEGDLRLADIRLLGLSLGIFLRSLANADPAGFSNDSSNAERILARWRSALDHAFPPQPQ
jgi:ABC-type transporter MlaC component